LVFSLQWAKTGTNSFIFLISLLMCWEKSLKTKLNIEASGVCCSNMGVKDRQTKQILYELDFTVDELLFYDLKHYVELPCSVHAISYVFFFFVPGYFRMLPSWTKINWFFYFRISLLCMICLTLRLE
jgi:hypothetical protein